MQQASNLADESCAQPGRVQAVVGLPSIEINQRSPPTSKGIIQRSPCDVQRTRKRGGRAWDVSFQLSLVESRAPCDGDKSRARF
jgi:hypothetical protein